MNGEVRGKKSGGGKGGGEARYDVCMMYDGGRMGTKIIERKRWDRRDRKEGRKDRKEGSKRKKQRNGEK